MNCFECNKEATNYVAWDDGLYDFCNECFEGVMQEAAARMTFPILMGAY